MIVGDNFHFVRRTKHVITTQSIPASGWRHFAITSVTALAATAPFLPLAMAVLTDLEIPEISAVLLAAVYAIISAPLLFHALRLISADQGDPTIPRHIHMIRFLARGWFGVFTLIIAITALLQVRGTDLEPLGPFFLWSLLIAALMGGVYYTTELCSAAEG